MTINISNMINFYKSLNFKIKLTLILSCLCLLTLLIWPRNKAEGDSDNISHGIPVSIENVQTREIKSVFKTYSYLLPYKEVTLRPNQDVKIKEILVEVGDQVLIDKPLVLIDSELQNLKKEADKIEAQLRNLDFTVTLALAKRNFLSQKEVEQKKLEHRAVQIRQRLSDLETKNEIKSPIAGVVSEIRMKKGDYIDGQSNSYIKVSDSSHFRVELYLPQNVATLIKKGDPVTLSRSQTLESSSEIQNATAHVTAISPTVDSKTGSVFTEITLENIPSGWIAGMFTEIEFTLYKEDQALSVPNQAIIYEKSKPYIFVVTDESIQEAPKRGLAQETQNSKSQDQESQGTKTQKDELEEPQQFAKKIPVKLGIKNSQYTQILEGAEELDQVVVEGQSSLSDGTLVQIVY